MKCHGLLIVSHTFTLLTPLFNLLQSPVDSTFVTYLPHISFSPNIVTFLVQIPITSHCRYCLLLGPAVSNLPKLQSFFHPVAKFIFLKLSPDHVITHSVMSSGSSAKESNTKSSLELLKHFITYPFATLPVFFYPIHHIYYNPVLWASFLFHEQDTPPPSSVTFPPYPCSLECSPWFP